MFLITNRKGKNIFPTNMQRITSKNLPFDQCNSLPAANSGGIWRRLSRHAFPSPCQEARGPTSRTWEMPLLPPASLPPPLPTPQHRVRPLPRQVSPAAQQMQPTQTIQPPQPTGGRRRRVVDEDPDERRRKFLERNRAAATRCRQKRKVWVMSLEKKAEELTQTNMQLQVRATVCAPEDTEALFMLGATPAQPAQHGVAGTIRVG